ncbi:transposase [Streptomyces sp. NPDC057271]|uniref:transposase n=1 Tax=unclassified Streptomyces TaxID=2593676 RepID=UPI003634A2BE
MRLPRARVRQRGRPSGPGAPVSVGHDGRGAGVTDAQSVRAAATVSAASRGYDGGKNMAVRKRHIVTDTLRLLLAVAVTLRTSATGTPRRAC